jgi:hypothetical protein
VRSDDAVVIIYADDIGQMLVDDLETSDNMMPVMDKLC